MKLQKELMGASTAVIILGILSKSPSYGYQIVKYANDEAGDLFIWQEGTIYPVLHKLEKDGFVRAQWEESEKGRKRKYYYITAKGRELLAKGAKEWEGFYNVILKFAEAPNG